MLFKKAKDLKTNLNFQSTSNGCLRFALSRMVKNVFNSKWENNNLLIFFIVACLLTNIPWIKTIFINGVAYIFTV